MVTANSTSTEAEVQVDEDVEDYDYDNAGDAGMEEEGGVHSDKAFEAEPFPPDSFPPDLLFFSCDCDLNADDDQR